MKKIITIKKYFIFLCVALIAFISFNMFIDSATASNSVNPENAASSKAKDSSKKGSISSETVILTVDSAPVYWPEFHFWLNYIGKYYKSYHNLEKITDWSAKQNDMNLKDFFLSCAVGYACKDRAIEAKAKELGLELSVQDLAEIEKKRKDNIQIYGSTSEYLHIIQSMYLSEEVFNYLTKIDYLGNYMFKHLYGANGEKCLDKDVYAYVEKAGFMCAKYIFLSNADSAGNKLSAEAIAKNHELLEKDLARLNTSDKPLALFDALVKDHDKDATASSYPDGRLFVSGSMGTEFESAYLKLKDNKYSGIVQTDKGYYVILRTPIFPNMTADSSGNTLRYLTAYEYLFKNQVEDLSAKMKIKYEDAYYKIDVEGLFK